MILKPTRRFKIEGFVWAWHKKMALWHHGIEWGAFIKPDGMSLSWCLGMPWQLLPGFCLYPCTHIQSVVTLCTCMWVKPYVVRYELRNCVLFYVICMLKVFKMWGVHIIFGFAMRKTVVVQIWRHIFLPTQCGMHDRSLIAWVGYLGLGTSIGRDIGQVACVCSFKK